VPFCDVLDVLKVEETPERESLKNGYAISKQWERIKEESLTESCKNSFKVKNFVNESSKDIITIKGKRLISAQKVIELSKLIKTCDSSKSKLSTLMEGGQYLSEVNYEKVLQIELDCAYLELNIKINEK